MSRRATREQETQDFLEQNPQLIEYQTRIEVLQIPVDDKCDDGPIMYPPMYGYDQGFFVEVTPDEGMPYPAFSAPLFSLSDVGTIAFFVEGGNFGLYGAQALGREGGDSLVTLSGAGFGVISFDEFFGDAKMDGPSGFADGFDRIDSSEALILDVFNGPFFGPKQTLLTEGPEVMETGGTSLGIDFTGTGRGTVQIVLVDLDTGEEFLQEMSFRGGRGGKDGYFEADMPEGQFEFAAITTTGTLEISVVGIDLGTNFNGGFPIGIA